MNFSFFLLKPPNKIIEKYSKIIFFSNELLTLEISFPSSEYSFLKIYIVFFFFLSSISSTSFTPYLIFDILLLCSLVTRKWLISNNLKVVPCEDNSCENIIPNVQQFEYSAKKKKKKFESYQLVKMKRSESCTRNFGQCWFGQQQFGLLACQQQVYYEKCMARGLLRYFQHAAQITGV